MIIHKMCGTKLISSGIGDFGYCSTCKKYVHHLVGYPFPEFSDEVIIKSGDIIS